MSKQSLLLSAAIAFLLVVSANAQDKSATPAAPGNGGGYGSGTVILQPRVEAGVVGGVIAGFGSTELSKVRGLPFSADVIDETDRFLADGNHIHREMHGRIFRDSEGRTRNERELGIPGAGRPVMIQIFDPVEEKMIVLQPEQKIASVHHFGGLQAAPGREPVRPLPKPQAGGASTTRPVGRFNNSRQPQNGPEDLGTNEIEGFTARGTRNVFTVPAGEVGNDKPMTNTFEHWYSEDLKTDLLTKSENPQSGTHVHRLVNIQSGDPDPLLFQVPPDYTVKELPQR